VTSLYSDKELKEASRILKALSNVVRLKILLMLAETQRPLHIEAVTRNLKMDYGAVYRHIKVLKQVGLLRIYEVGRSRVLSPIHMDLVKQFIENAKVIAK
jgi:DNA-binding transcriptional ArsR family regulator